MLARRSRDLNALNISALDLFASALGVFILMTLILFPYYLKQPSVEQELAGAQARGALAAEALALATEVARGASDELSDAEQARASREAEKESASQRLQALRQSLAQAQRKAAAQPKPQPTPEPDGGFARIPELDLVLVMDTTGSMHRAIDDVQRSLLGMVRVLQRLTPRLRVGFVAFKDRGDTYLTRRLRLTDMSGMGLPQLQGFVQDLEASGGGTYPEPVGVALLDALRMDWRDDAQGRIVIIGDAPDTRSNRPHVLDLAANFAASSRKRSLPRRVSTVFTGHRQRGWHFYRDLARAGSGDAITDQGGMLVSVLLSILDGPDSGRGSGR